VHCDKKNIAQEFKKINNIYFKAPADTDHKKLAKFDSGLNTFSVQQLCSMIYKKKANFLGVRSII
jgi:hypothetical protein